MTSTEQEIRACSADSGDAALDDREDGRITHDSASSSKSCMSTSKSENYRYQELPKVSKLVMLTDFFVGSKSGRKTEEQLEVLEESFRRRKYPTAEELDYLMHETDLSTASIKVYYIYQPPKTLLA